jgi:hypothetical protein
MRALTPAAGRAGPPFAGQTLRIVGGSPAGGIPDRLGRLLAAHLARRIPGVAGVEVEPDPRGHVAALNAVYHHPPQDGTLLGLVIGAEIRHQLVGDPAVAYDTRRIQWLGAVSRFTHCVALRSDLDARDVRDIVGGPPLTLAGRVRGSSPHDTPIVLNAVLGTRFRVRLGYDGMDQMLAAVRSGEAHGLSAGFQTMLLAAPDLLEGERPFLRVVVVMGDRTPGHPVLAGVPAAEALADTPADRALLRAVSDPRETRAQLGVGPDVPRARVLALRSAFADIVRDPAFLEESRRLADMPVLPSPPAGVQRSVARILGTPSEVLERLRTVLAADRAGVAA